MLLGNTPTVTHNSKHYSVQTADRCNTSRFISSLVIELAIQSVATNTDFSSWLFISYFETRHSSGDADQLVLSTVLGTLDSRPSALFGITEYEMLFVGDYNSDWTAYKTC